MEAEHWHLLRYRARSLGFVTEITILRKTQLNFLQTSKSSSSFFGYTILYKILGVSWPTGKDDNAVATMSETNFVKVTISNCQSKNIMISSLAITRFHLSHLFPPDFAIKLYVFGTAMFRVCSMTNVDDYGKFVSIPYMLNEV